MKLSIDKLKPGMRVISEVANLNHAVLLPADTILLAQHLRLLKMWGIDAVEVAEAPSELESPRAAEDLPGELVRQAEAIVSRRMKHVPLAHPAVTLVRDLAIRRAAHGGGAIPA